MSVCLHIITFPSLLCQSTYTSSLSPLCCVSLTIHHHFPLSAVSVYLHVTHHHFPLSAVSVYLHIITFPSLLCQSTYTSHIITFPSQLCQSTYTSSLSPLCCVSLPTHHHFPLSAVSVYLHIITFPSLLCQSIYTSSLSLLCCVSLPTHHHFPSLLCQSTYTSSLSPLCCVSLATHHHFPFSAVSVYIVKAHECMPASTTSTNKSTQTKRLPINHQHIFYSKVNTD